MTIENGHKTATTERPPSPENGHQEEEVWPPRGITFETREGRAQPFFARWRESGVRKTCSFADEATRDKFAKNLLKVWGKQGPMVEIPKRSESDRWKIFAELTGGADPVEVARFWLKHKKTLGGKMTVAEARDKFLLTREKKSVSDDTSSHLELHLKRFVKASEKLSMADLSPDFIRLWMYGKKDPASGRISGGLKDPETGELMAPYTLRHHLRSVRLFLDRAVDEGWIEKSPADTVDMPDIEETGVTVATVEDITTLFEKNKQNPCIGRLALEAFGGLRYTSAARLVEDEIDWADLGITMPGAKHKTGKRHYIDGYPDNLWAWLKHAPKACWKIPQRVYLDMKADAFTVAGVTNPGNILRHSFCSYHIAMHKDAARTAVLLTHRSPSMLYQHYKGKAKQADALRYFSIMP